MASLGRTLTAAPELNPQEHNWDELRKKGFPNRSHIERSVE